MDENEMDKALHEMKENSRHMIEAMFAFARINRAFFEALLAQGFSQEQALELVKAQVLTMLQGGKTNGPGRD